MVGFINPKTLRAWGSVGEQPFVVLIDPRATHNFIFKKMVEVLKILVLATMGFGVRLGNGDQIPIEGVGGFTFICRVLKLLKISFLNLGRNDVILSIRHSMAGNPWGYFCKLENTITEISLR